jgi:hypothetical protein
LIARHGLRRWDADYGAWPIDMRVWVDALGYITAIPRQTLAGPGDPVTLFDGNP